MINKQIGLFVLTSIIIHYKFIELQTINNNIKSEP